MRWLCLAGAIAGILGVIGAAIGLVIARRNTRLLEQARKTLGIPRLGW